MRPPIFFAPMRGLRIHHLNAGRLHAPPAPAASCHCVLLEFDGRLVLIDSGIGLHDIARPLERIGQDAISAAGFIFDEALTLARQLEQLGFARSAVSDILLTHADPDHAGGLADFPQARVHLSAEELAAVQSGAPRYSMAQFEHRPHWTAHAPSAERWFGLESRRVPLPWPAEVWLVPLFGHTRGHCGVAVRDGARWLLHVGDAYYLRVELTTDDHPVSKLATMRADDDAQRRASLQELRRLARDQGTEIDLFGTHDFSELPPVRDGRTAVPNSS